MKRIPLGNEQRIEQRLFFCVIAFLVLSLLLVVLAALLWMPLIIGEGVLITAYGVIHLVAAHKGWDRFFSFSAGGTLDRYRSHHIHTVLSGMIFVLVGIGGTILLLLVFSGVIG